MIATQKRFENDCRFLVKFICKSFDSVPRERFIMIKGCGMLTYNISDEVRATFPCRHNHYLNWWIYIFCLFFDGFILKRDEWNYFYRGKHCREKCFSSKVDLIWSKPQREMGRQKVFPYITAKYYLQQKMDLSEHNECILNYFTLQSC